MPKGKPMNRVVWRWIACAAVVCSSSALLADSPPAGAASDRNIKQAFTLPFKEYKISFPTMGVIKEVKVKEGDAIKKGDMIMKQDDSEEKAELRLLELDVNDYPIKAAEAKFRAAEAEFQGKERMKAQGAGSDIEWEHARAERDVAKVQIEASQQELKQKEAKRDKQAIHVNNMTLLAPTDGVVKELLNDVGSNIDPTKPVVTVVENNPLLVEVQVPALASLQVQKGEKLRISYDKKNWREAAVSFLSPQADAGSGMRMIRLELPNPNGEPSGLQVFVELPDKLLASAEK
jgi:RND family efflux transporter MFP subunit